MTTDHPTTPRAALLDFAAYLDQHEMPAPMPSSVYAQLAREHAEGLPDFAGELLTTEHTCGLPDTDELRRGHALYCAALVSTRSPGGTTYGHIRPALDVVHDARIFEAYLRDGEDVVIVTTDPEAFK